MELNVTGCKDCPFHIISEYYQAFCGHPILLSKNLGDYQSETPDWCPLKKEGISVAMVKESCFSDNVPIVQTLTTSVDSEK